MLVSTIYGDKDDSTLERRDFVVDNENEYTKATEYWLAGELVHRSAHVTIKNWPTAQAVAGAF